MMEEVDHRLNCSDLSPELPCSPNWEKETRAQIMSSGFDQAARTALIDCMYDIEELIVLVSNGCGLNTTEIDMSSLIGKLWPSALFNYDQECRGLYGFTFLRRSPIAFKIAI